MPRLFLIDGSSYLYRAFHALRHKERYRTRAADALTDLIKEQVA